jgi:ribosome-associated translation inhibitor RaiA
MVMKPLDIRFLEMAPSEALEVAARAKAHKLEQVCPQMMSCRVTIERQHRHQHQGQPYAVRVDVTWAGHELSVDRVHDEDVYVALRDAFDDMQRRVEDAVHRDRGQEKVHPVPLHGEVVRLSADPRCGFIRTGTGDEYWFGPENVADAPFEHVALGAQVQFLPDPSAGSPQAKRVSLGKHRFG